jgi:hypothetical protein
VKLYDSNYWAMKALGNFGIEVMVEIPNHMLQSLATNIKGEMGCKKCLQTFIFLKK